MDDKTKKKARQEAVSKLLSKFHKAILSGFGKDDEPEAQAKKEVKE